MPLLNELFSKHKDQTIEIINDKQSPLNLMKQSLNKEKNKKWHKPFDYMFVH